MSLETIAQELLDATEASRTTIRFDVPDDPYLPVFAEAVVPGVRAIRDEADRGGATSTDLQVRGQDP